jgi:hypothetical protein
VLNPKVGQIYYLKRKLDLLNQNKERTKYMSATSYTLAEGNHGVVKVGRYHKELIVMLHATDVIKLDLSTGRAKLNTGGNATMQTSNCFNRFFELIDCNRYSTKLTKGKIILYDKRAAKTTVLDREVTVGIPVKGVIKALCSIGASHSLIQYLGTKEERTLVAEVPF